MFFSQKTFDYIFFFHTFVVRSIRIERIWYYGK